AASTPADVGGRPLPAQLAEAQEPEGHRRVEVAAAAPPEGRVHDGGAVGDQLGQRRRERGRAVGLDLGIVRPHAPTPCPSPPFTRVARGTRLCRTAWPTQAEAAHVADTISILDGSTFVVSDRRGDIDAAPDQPHGLFFRDTRFLSRWRLSLEGGELAVLSTDDVDYFSAQFFLYPPTGTIYR